MGACYSKPEPRTDATATVSLSLSTQPRPTKKPVPSPLQSQTQHAENAGMPMSPRSNSTTSIATSATAKKHASSSDVKPPSLKGTGGAGGANGGIPMSASSASISKSMLEAHLAAAAAATKSAQGQTIVTESSQGGPGKLMYSQSPSATTRRRWPAAQYIVGIDFGTTFSGFSVMQIPSDGSEPRKVLCCTGWRDQPPRVASPKAPTVLNYSVTPNGVFFTHWGWTADAVPIEPHLRRVERVKLLLGGLTDATGELIRNPFQLGTASSGGESLSSSTASRHTSTMKTRDIEAGSDSPGGITLAYPNNNDPVPRSYARQIPRPNGHSHHTPHLSPPSTTTTGSPTRSQQQQQQQQPHHHHHHNSNSTVTVPQPSQSLPDPEHGLPPLASSLPQHLSDSANYAYRSPATTSSHHTHHLQHLAAGASGSSLQLAPIAAAISKDPKHALIFRNVTLPDGLSPREVIADYLRSMKQICMEMIVADMEASNSLRWGASGSVGAGGEIGSSVAVEGKANAVGERMVDAGEIVFCMTVPVFWTQAQMHIMREAAALAGLIAKVDSENLIFCHEPVAAALAFVRSPAMRERLLRGIGGGGVHLSGDGNGGIEGAKALIVDAGGGTVDIFQCTIKSAYEISELTQAAGDFFGASLVDEHFWSFFESQIGTGAFDELHNNPDLRVSYRNIMVQWDSFKREFREDESAWTDRYTGGYKPFVLSRALCDVIEPEAARKLPGRGSEVRVTLADMKRFFDPAVDAIVAMVGDQLEEVKGQKSEPIDYLFLVGGFCSNQYLRRRLLTDERIRGRFREVPTIEQPEGAVLEGAAWYAWNSNTVARRKARVTLGVKLGRPYDAEVDRLEDVVNPNDPKERWAVYKRFHVFVRRGDPVDHGATYTRDNFTIMGGKPTVDVVVYGSMESEPRDVTDPQCEVVGKVTVDTRRWSSGGEVGSWDPRKNTFRIEIEYGNVEIWVRARPNGVESKTAEELEFRATLAVEKGE
ncbi:hypothetical protein BJ742DRAFT_906058 [Cladochytrium replicatum]|nr:hypothetical protein BJ742DRAFT_906058 [Cladochytrium replicatum]